MKIKFLLLFCFLLISISTFSQKKEIIATEPKTSELKYFFAVIVTDISNSIKWYEEVLGFESVNFREVESVGLKQANLKRNDVFLELIALKSAIKPNEAIQGFDQKSKLTGLFKIGFAVEGFEDFLKHIDNKTGANALASVVSDPNSNTRTVIINDPDSNRIQLFEN